MQPTRRFSRAVLRFGIAALLVLPVVVALAAPEKSPAPAAKVEDDTRTTKADVIALLRKKAGRRPAGTSIPGKTPWVWCCQQYDANEKKPNLLYYLIAEHLVVADKRFLASKDEETRRKGLGMTVEACRCAFSRLKDKELASMICEVYLEPNLDCADSRHWKYLGRQNVLEMMASVQAEVRNATKLIEIYRQIIDGADDRNTADGARLRLAQVLDKKERYAEAIAVLKEIDDDAGVAGGKRLIPIIEKKQRERKKP